MNEEQQPISSTESEWSRRYLAKMGLAGLMIGIPGLANAAPSKKAPAKVAAKSAPKGGGKGHAPAVRAVAPSSGPPPRIVQREAALVPRLTSQTAEGAHYIDVPLLRSDITEGQAGVPLEVRFVVVDQTGLPFGGALVDVWHCDAQGRYSGFDAQGDDHGSHLRGLTFLRGRQAADRNGVAVFRTIYPGWHEGRTTHIHFKVWNGENAVLTSQVLMPDALSEYLYTQHSDYRRGTVRDTLNSTDAIALDAGHSVLGSVREEREQYVVTLAIAVDRSVRPQVGQPSVVPTDRVPSGGSNALSRPAALQGSARTQAILPGRR